MSKVTPSSLAVFLPPNEELQANDARTESWEGIVVSQFSRRGSSSPSPYTPSELSRLHRQSSAVGSLTTRSLESSF